MNLSQKVDAAFAQLFSFDVLTPSMLLLDKLLGFCVGAVIGAVLSVVVCLPYLFAASTADRNEYWASFWARAKRIAAAGGTLGGFIGVCLVPWK